MTAFLTALHATLGILAVLAFLCGLLYLACCLPPVRAWLNRPAHSDYLAPWSDRAPGEIEGER